MAYMEQRAQELVTEAEKKLHSKNVFLLLFGMKTKIHEAIECYEKAGHLFKLSKNWNQAGSAYRNAANLNNQNQEQHEAANNFISASKCFMKSDYSNTIDCLLSAIQIYTDMGKFIMVAKQHQIIAEIYENHTINLNSAIQHYEQAADYFKFEENYCSARKCLLKVAQYSSELENYTKAINIFEEIAAADLKNEILHYSAKTQFFRAAICHLCIDVLNAKHALDSYHEQYPGFEECREFLFLQNIIQCIEDCDVDLFVKTVTNYDSICHMDFWYTKMLLRIKNEIKEYPDLL